MNEKEKKHFKKIQKAVSEGYGGVNPGGIIVDRREYPKATPLLENKLLKTPKPKSVVSCDHKYCLDPDVLGCACGIKWENCQYLSKMILEYQRSNFKLPEDRNSIGIDNEIHVKSLEEIDFQCFFRPPNLHDTSGLGLLAQIYEND